MSLAKRYVREFYNDISRNCTDAEALEEMKKVVRMAENGLILSWEAVELLVRIYREQA